MYSIKDNLEEIITEEELLLQTRFSDTYSTYLNSLHLQRSIDSLLDIIEYVCDYSDYFEFKFYVGLKSISKCLYLMVSDNIKLINEEEFKRKLYVVSDLTRRSFEKLKDNGLLKEIDNQIEFYLKNKL